MEGVKSFAKRDWLLENEAQARKWWEEANVFKADAGEKPPAPGEKLFGNLPYLYMKGHLQLGHGFSASKLEFGSANVLLPFAFHCAGMPIKALADKLVQETKRYGNPLKFPSIREKEVDETKRETVEGNFGSQDFFPDIKCKKSKENSKSRNKQFQ